PCPVTSPAAASPAKVYSGQPSRVTWCLPSGVSMVASSPVTPSAFGSAESERIGGHCVRQAPVQALVAAPCVSLSYMYAVIPLPSTTTDPSEVSATFSPRSDAAGCDASEDGAP